MVEYNILAHKENHEKSGGRVSFSQYSMWKKCPRSWKLKYIDKIKQGPSIHMTFGTAMHETLQHYIYVAHTESGVEADKINLSKLLHERMMFNYDNDKKDGEHFSNLEEMEEFYYDGVAILEWIKNHRNDFFQLKDMELVGIEIPINRRILGDYDVNLVGYIDVVFREISTGKIFIIDIKTSTSGWKKFHKEDKSKTAQLVLYKMYFAEQYDCDIKDIDVSFHIVKRKIPKDPEYKVMLRRLQKFEPTSGTKTQKQLKESFEEFVISTHNKDGSRRTDVEYPALKNGGKNCKYCDFKDRHDLCNPADRK